MSKVKFIRLKLFFTAQDKIYLPEFSGSAFRGGFGAALRRSCCTMHHNTCNGCMLIKSCVYSLVFETSFNHISDSRYRLSDYPRPFIIESPFLKNNNFQSGETFSCNLILIGKAIDLMPYFVFAFKQLGQHGIGTSYGKYKIDKITNAFEENRKVVFDGNSEEFTNDLCIKYFNEFTNNKKECSNLFLKFQTPTRIKYHGSLTKNLSFYLLMKSLFRRLSLLMIVCKGISLDIDYKTFLHKAKKIELKTSGLFWYDWERLSHRQKTRMKLGGFLGDIKFSGELTEFLPYIKMCEFLHIGKNCTFGLGKYIIK